MKTSKLMYSFQFPESRKVLKEMWATFPHYLFDNNYLDAQSGKEIEFFEMWKYWAHSVSEVTADYKFFYPTNGSSESIKEIIYKLKIKNRRLVIFNNDYEGYKAYANSADLNFIELDRNESLNFNFAENDTLIISQPSSLDGNMWEKYDSLMNRLQTQFPKTEVYIDLCYVGTVAKDYKINLEYSNIQGLFISLSKVYGVYFHRIGGLISKKEEAGLFGNKWFKNMFSLEFGIKLMQAYSVKELAQKYLPLQKNICEELSQKLSKEIQPSDVILLANSKSLVEDYIRGDISRFCLTPGLDQSSGGPYDKNGDSIKEDV